MTSPWTPDGAAARLRQEFDAAFARPAAGPATASVDLLVVAVASQPFAVRLSELAGVLTGRRVVPAPSSARGFLGLSGIRGSVTPVFDLAELLGLGRTGAAPAILLAGGLAPVGLACGSVERHLRLAPSGLVAAAAGATPHVAEVALSGGQTLPVLRLSSIVQVITGAAPTAP